MKESDNLYNELQNKIFLDRYALKDTNGNLLEKEASEMWLRLAKVAASKEENVEVWENEFYWLLKDFRFVPGGRILSGLGKPGVSAYNCFILDSPSDSREGIMDNLSKAVDIMARGGGIGVNLSTLRPRGAYIKGTDGHSSGAVSWGELYDKITGVISQGGSRRGASILTLRIDHPDIEEFITVKRDESRLNNANLSVLVTNDFMDALKSNDEWELKFDGKTYKILEASYLWDLICKSAWACGEPGLIFIDEYNKKSNSWYFDEIIGCNPCGEIGGGKWNVCNLGHLNLTSYISKGKFDYARFTLDVRRAVRFLDNVIDITSYFLKENEIAQLSQRRIGLSTMGLADALIMLKIRYGSNESLKFIEKVYGILAREAYISSINLAEEKGAFPKFDFDKYFLENKDSFAYKMYHEWLPSECKEKATKTGIRNVTLLTQAPTGSTSLLAGVSSGIEPNFSFEYERKDNLGKHLIKHPLWEAWLKENPDEDVPNYFVTAKDISVDEHLKVQATIQKYLDSSISKTINAPSNHSVEEVKKAYLKAYELGCKGITYYRDGSRSEQVLNEVKERKEELRKDKRGYIQPALKEAKGIRKQLITGCGKMWVMIFTDLDGNIIETFVNTGSKGGCTIFTQATSRLISLGLRGGIALEDVIDQLESAGVCPAYQHAKGKGVKVSPGGSCPQAIAKLLQKVQKQLKEGDIKVPEHFTSKEEGDGRLVCPECKEKLNKSEGCLVCSNCGYSKCN